MSYMKAEFDRVLKQFGHKVYLNRRVRAAEGDDEGGYSNLFEIHLTRHRGAVEAGTRDQMLEGILNNSDRVYYFRSEVQPFDGDRIYETDPRVQRPVTQTVWVVDTALPLRGLAGEIEYYVVGTTRLRP